MLALLIVAVIAVAVILLAAAVLASARRERGKLLRDQDAERQMWRNERADLIGMHQEASAELQKQMAVERARLLEGLVKAERDARNQLAAAADEHREAVAELLERHDEERTSWRNQERELLNRIQHPTVMPTGVRQTVAPPDPGRTASDVARAAWQGVGRIAMPAPVNGGTDSLGDDVP